MPITRYRYKILSPILLFLALSLSAPLNAAEDDTSATPESLDTEIILESSSLVLDPILVEAASFLGGDAAARLDRPIASQVVAGDELRRFQSQQIGDDLRKLPGITHSGPPGEIKDLRIRGFDKGYNLHTINNMPIYGTSKDRQFRVDRLPSFMVEAVELSHIPTADRYHDGIGGTIDIRLRDIPDRQFYGLRQGTSLYNGREVGASLSTYAGDGRGDFGWLMSAGFERRFGGKDEQHREFNADGSLREFTTKTEHKTLDDGTIASRLRWHLRDDLSLTVQAAYLDQRESKTEEEFRRNSDLELDRIKFKDETKEYPVITGSATLDWHLDAHRFALTVGGGWGRETKDKFEFEERFNNNGITLQRIDVKETDHERSEDRGYLFRLTHHWDLDDQSEWAMGAEWQARERIDEKRELEYRWADLAARRNDDRTNEGVKDEFFRMSEDILTLWTKYTFELGDHQFIPGLRFEHVRHSSRERKDSLISDERGSNNNYLLPSLHYRYRINQRVALRAASAYLVKRPKFDDLSPLVDERNGTANQPDRAGNPDLENETAIVIQVGADFDYREYSGTSGGIRFFHHWLNDVIAKRDMEESGRFVERPRNLGDARVYGIEADVRQDINVGPVLLSPWGNVALLYSRLDEGGGNPTTRIPEQPNYIAALGLDAAYTPQGLRAGIAFDISGRKSRDQPNRTGFETSIVWMDAYASWEFTPHWTATISGKNLLNSEKIRRETNLGNNRFNERSEISSPTLMFSLAGEF